MENDKWNNVLVEWVNCLKLCKIIYDVNELRTGEFFKCLQKLITKSNIPAVDNLTFIFSLFQKHYPSYTFENKTEVHLADIPDNDLKAIVSLLMHYTCVFDRRDVLTAPMCHSLSPPTQLIIRNFLEKITKNITTENMNLIINSCIDNVSQQWVTIQTSNNTNSSPLLDILKTPLSKIGRYQDKERYISKLKSDLEAERYERSVLEGELKNHKKNNTKLEGQLQKQKLDINRLKEEVLALEQKTPSHYVNTSSKQLEQKLKEQILSLEQCIDKLENEQIEIQKEKETAESQLEKVIGEATIWKEQCFDTERQLDYITEHSQKDKDEIKALRNHCDELTRMLDELKAKENGKDTSLSFNESLPCIEDLGAAVVEVQLREVKEQNQVLKTEIEQITETADTLKAKLEENEEKLMQSELNRNHLLNKVSLLEVQHNNDQKQLSEALLDITSQKEHSESLTTQLKNSQNTAEQLQFELGGVLLENQELCSKIITIAHEKDELGVKLYNSEQALDEKCNVLSTLERELECLKMSNCSLAQELEKSTLCSSMLENKIADLVQTCEQLKETNATYIQENENVQKHLSDALHDCENFKENIQNLENNCESTNKQLSILQQLLQDTQNERDTIEGKLDKSNEEIERLDRIKEDLENKFQKLNHELGMTTQQNTQLLQENQSIQSQFHKTLQKLEENEKQIKNLTTAQEVFELNQKKSKTTINVLQQNNIELLEEKEKVRSLQDFTENQLKGIENAKSLLEEKNLELIDCVSNLQDELSERSCCLEAAYKEIFVLKEEKCELLINLEQANTQLNTLHNRLKDVLDDKRKIIDELNKNKTLLNTSQQETKTLITQMQKLEVNCLKTIELFEDKYNRLLQKVENANEKLVTFQETGLKNIINSNMKLEKLLIEANLAIQEKHAAIVLLDLQNESYLKQIEELKQSKITLENNLDQKLIATIDIKNNLERDKDNLLWKVACLEGDNKKLAKNNEEVEQELTKMLGVIQDRFEVQSNLEGDLNQISILKDALEQNNLDLNQQIREAGINYARLENEMKDKIERIIDEKNCLEIKTREVGLEMESIKVFYKNVLNDNKVALENAEKQNKLLESKLTSLEGTKVKYEEELINLRTIFDEKLLEVQRLSIEVQKENEMLAQLQNTIDGLEKRCLQLNDFNIVLQTELDASKKSYETAELCKNLLQKELENTRNELIIAKEREEEFEQKCVRLDESKMVLLENFNELTGDLECNKLSKDALQQKINDFEVENCQLSETCRGLKEEILNGNHYKSQYDDVKLDLQNVQNELETTKENLERVNVEKLCAETQILDYESKCQSLNETIQDYELTISGLKKIVDSDYTELSNLQAQILEINSIKSEIRQFIDGGLDDEINKTNIKQFVCETIKKMAENKNNLQEKISTLEKEMDTLKQKSSTTIEMNESMFNMIQKIQCLFIDQSETNTCNYDDVYKKIHETLTAKLQLADALEKIKDEQANITKELDNAKKEKEMIHQNKVELEEKLKAFNSTNKPNKENILGVSTKGNKSDDLKKQNDVLKKKIVIIEHSRNNLEKVVKELREEKKNKRAVSPTSDDVYYKKLLKEYIEVKEQHERIVAEKDKEISILKSTKKEPDLSFELQNVRQAYSHIMSNNSKLELEIVTLRKVLEERNSELSDLIHIKEAYEKLLEENNKALTETDTMKYKRIRDKEEFIRLLKKEREDGTHREMKKVQEIRNEYEAKLEKMKEKMLKLYREEVNKKEKSRKEGNMETQNYTKTIDYLYSKLQEAEKKIEFFELGQKIATDLPFRIRQDEKASTLPRQSIGQETTVSRRTSIGDIPSLQMEDEEEFFNNKYLMDLKAGNCTNKENGSSTVRFSELAMRNSMVPPHLKSSYPAEMQFISPRQFKDEDLKTGNVEFEDSLCKLLPFEKPRKKDFGTTSYKRPGPPTPSKNGGRLSLQGNEVHPMRDYGEEKALKKSTPSRIRALFTGRTSTSSSESQYNTTPNRGSKRLNIFRKPR